MKGYDPSMADFQDSDSENQNHSGSSSEQEDDREILLLNSTFKPTKSQSQFVLPDDVVKDKSNKWRTTHNKRFSERRKFGYVENQKEILPPEVLR